MFFSFHLFGAMLFLRRCFMKILLATDGSECSEGAARFLTQMNFTSEDEITVLHVISRIPFKDDTESYHASLMQAKQEIAPGILDSCADILQPLSAKISTALLDGYPDKSIVEQAADSGADLTVVGARGIKGIKSLFIGSVTRAVAAHSPKPTLVIKRPQWEISGRLKVLFATDGSDHADGTGRFLASLPLPDDTEITIINVIWPTLRDIPERYTMAINDRFKAAVARERTEEYADSEKVIRKAREYLAKRFKNINELTVIGDPSEEILNEAEKLNADIIAVGSKGLRGVKGMLGSVSRNILGHSRCSVLIGKE
jgi:nucleotide-binding universal stress UspA family protein